MATVTCEHCAAELPPGAAICPTCTYPRGRLSASASRQRDSALAPRGRACGDLTGAEPLPASGSHQREPASCTHEQSPPGAMICTVCGAPIGLRRSQPADPAEAPKGRPRAAHLAFPWGDVVVPAGDPVLLGREVGPAVDALVAMISVSRRHCEVHLVPDGLRVTDHQSTNGTFRNGTPLLPGVATAFTDGDELSLGRSLRCRIRIEMED